jgi:hypothetical protein
MSFKPDTIAKMVLNRLNDTHFLPAIQREFVWGPGQIEALFDSVMRGYPISSFLLWELDSSQRDEWDAYEFLGHASQRGNHNRVASTAGIRNLTLVLDGQQRLTALNVGLKGFYETKRPRAHWNNPGAWVKRRLYLDLLKDARLGADEAEPDDGMRYRFSFRAEGSDGSAGGAYWFRVGQILDARTNDDLEDLIESEQRSLPEGTDTGQVRAFNRNLRRLHEVVWRDDVVWHHTEEDPDYDRVLDIFVRANSGGTPLSKSDLLLSMVTARWTEVNAREEIFGFVDRLNGELARPNNFSKDFVLKTCLVLSDLPVQYRVQNFSDKNLGLIFERWASIKAAIEAGVNLANRFGLDRETLLSANALIPVIYYLQRRGGVTLRGTSAFDAENSRRIRRWLTAAMLNNVFSGASDNVLRETRSVLKERLDAGEWPFPDQALDSRIAELGRATRLGDAMVDEVLSLSYGDRRAFLALTLLYDRKDWGLSGFHQDHIIPRSLFTDDRLREAGVPEERWERHKELRDRLGNLELLLPEENLEKSAKDFSGWVATREDGFRREHLIPDDDGLLTLGRFEDFVSAREELIRERLRGLFVEEAGGDAEEER